MTHEDYEYCPPWDWVPIELMPDGCSDVEVMYQDGSVKNYCSCDYWHDRLTDKEQPILFR